MNVYDNHIRGGGANWKNRTLFIHDNLPILRGMNSNSVGLIATDPPFNTKRQFNAPLGSKSAGQKFKDRWRWDEVTDEWHDLIATNYPAIKELIEAAVVIEGGSISSRGEIDTGKTKNSIAAFLVWMAPRLIEMRRVLKPTGSIYLHCDPTASHFLKLLMDSVFGRKNFRNEIVWQRVISTASSKVRARRFPTDHDIILFYGNPTSFTMQYRPYDANYVQKNYRHNDNDGRGPYSLPELASATDERISELERDGRLVRRPNAKSHRYKNYLRDKKGVPVNDIWTDIMPLVSASKERTGWKTQKPLALYQRIIEASSNKGDIVLDPFCGCATTCVAAEKLERQWVGIDIDPVAEKVTKERLYNVSGLAQQIDDSFVTVKKRPPRRTDTKKVTKDHMRLTMWKKQGRRCANPYCSLDEMRKEDIHLDHVIPRSRGGADDIDNRIALCGNCNMRKSNKAWGAFLDEERSNQPHPSIG